MSAVAVENQHRPRVAFIGSVVSPGGIDRAEITAAAVTLTYDNLAQYPDVICHSPQTPQLGREYGMDHEAVLGFPLLAQDAKGRLVYQMSVSPDTGEDPGKIIFPKPENQEIFDRLDLKVNEFLAAVATGDRAEVNHRLFAIASDPSVNFEAFRRLPPGLQHLIDRLKSENIKTSGPIKTQTSGPVNTTLSIHTLTPDGEVADTGKILENRRMLTFHAGLILARSLIWAMSLKPFTRGDIYLSFDEPDFANIASGVPSKEQVDYVYSLLWGNPDALPYKRFVHVCSSLATEVMPYVDYLNFDALTGADLARGHEDRIRKFFERPDAPGHLVLGITPTNAVDLVNTVPELKQEISPLEEISDRFSHISSDQNFLTGLLRLVTQKRDTSSIKMSNVRGLLQQYDIKGVDALTLHDQLMLVDDNYRIRVLLEKPDLQKKLRAACAAKIAYVINALTDSGIPRAEVINHLLISPQCGLGSWRDCPYGADYTQLVYDLTRELAESELR